MKLAREFVTDIHYTEEEFKKAIKQHGPAETAHDLINLFCTSHDEWRDEDCMQVYRGFSPDIDTLWKALPPSFQQREDWSEYPYRVIWTSEEEFSTCTYRNGEVTITLHPRRASFLLELQYAEEHFNNS